MRVLCSMPGRAGDLLWAMPCVRAISEHFGVPCDLQTCGEFSPLVPLLAQQPYIGLICPDAGWSMSEGWEPLHVAADYDHTFHLGNRRWPELPLPYETLRTAQEEYDLPIQIDLDRPWITVDGPAWRYEITCGWTDCHFELKYGLMQLLFPDEDPRPVFTACAPGSRWVTEGLYFYTDWLEVAERLTGCRVFLGDCSALHVLAVAMGKQVVLMEPMEARHNPIFYPLGKTGRVRLVTGNDGLPTTDSRHTADVLKEVLHAHLTR